MARYYNSAKPQINYATDAEFAAAALANPTNPDYHPWQITVCSDAQWAEIKAANLLKGVVL